MTDKERVLDKIKKCLAMGKSSNANEAAIAMRQAQKLMDKHGIDADEIEALGYGVESVDMPVQANKTPPTYIMFFLGLMNHAFGVRPIISRTVRVSDASYTVVYAGPKARVMTAAYAHTVCWRAMTAEWTTYLKANPSLRGHRGARSGFYIGWIEEVRAKVEAIGFTDDETARTELAMKKEGMVIAPIQGKSINVSNRTSNAGAEAGRNFSIHRPVDADRKRLN